MGVSPGCFINTVIPAMRSIDHDVQSHFRASHVPEALSFHRQDRCLDRTTDRQANLYSVKMASYKDSYGKIIQRKQNEPPGGAPAQASEGRGRAASRPAAPRIGRRSLSSWRLA